MLRSKGRTRLMVRALEDRIAPAIFTVTNTLDSGFGSLRQAISDSNGNTGADQIAFDATFNSPQTITLVNALPAISGDLTMTGPGSNKLTVARDVFAGDFRILTISNTSAAITVDVSGMTLTKGSLVADGSDQTDNGGGIFVGDEAVTLTDVVVSNSTSNAQGGGIAVGKAGQLTLINCTITGNTAQGLVGGDPLSPGFSGVGGGIYFTYDGILTMNGCTVSSNTAKYQGGGVFLFGEKAGTATIRNSTFANNKTTSIAAPGIFYNWDSGGAAISAQVNLFPGNTATMNLTVQNCTLVNNSAQGSGAKGGGILASTSRTTLTVASSIASGNTATTGADISATKQISLTASAIGVGTGFTFSGSGNLAFGTALMLGSLGNNGGNTQTIAPLSGSPVIDKGSNPGSLSTDQRGAGFVRAFNAVDIGAVEVQPVGLPTAIAVSPDVVTAGGTTFDVTVTYSDPDGINVGTLGLADITVTNSVGTKFNPTSFKVDNGTNGTPRVATYTINAPNGAWGSNNTGVYTINVNASEVADMTGAFVPAGPAGSFKNLIPRALVVLNTNDSGAGSFRQAIIDANNLGPSNDIITFSPAVFTGGQIIEMKTGPYSITDSVTIQGPGATKLTIDALFASRHLVIDGPGILNVIISGMTLTQGRTNSEGIGDRGGSVSINAENVTFDNVFLTSNSVQRNNGGAINLIGAAQLTFKNGRLNGNVAQAFNISPIEIVGGGGGAISAQGVGHSILIEDSLISGNNATYYGGAIYSIGGDVTTNRCRFLLNQTLNTLATEISGYSGGGGAIQVGFVGNPAIVSSLSVSDSLFENNKAAGYGGAASMLGNISSVLFSNSTISGNQANLNTNSGAGGGLFFIATGAAPLVVRNCTIAYNQAFSGGGIFASADPAYIVNGLALTSTILAKNLYADPGHQVPDIDGFLVADNSLIGVLDGGVLNGGSNTQTGSASNPLDPMIETLAYNGGTSNTIALLPGSPCIDAGSNPANLSFDQRGAGFPRVSNGTADIGAFELQVAVPPEVSSVTIGDGSVQRSVVRSLTVTFSTLVTLGGGTPEQAFEIKRTGPGSPMTTVNLSADLTGSTATQTIAKLTFSGSLTEFASLIDGRYTLTIFASQVVDNSMTPMTADVTNNFLRLFGDADGNGTVNTVDFNAFRTAFGGSSTIFDFDNAGGVGTLDFNQFRVRFGSSV